MRRPAKECEECEGMRRNAKDPMVRLGLYLHQ